MKVIFKMGLSLVKEHFNGEMDQNILEILIMDLLMEKVLLKQIIIHILEIGRMGQNMEREYGKVDNKYMMVILKREKSQDLESLHFKVELYMRVNFLTINQMEREIYLRTKEKLKGYGWKDNICILFDLKQSNDNEYFLML